MYNTISTKAINRDFYFPIGITERVITFLNHNIKFYIYRPMNMTSSDDIIIYLPGRNGSAQEYLQETMFMSSYNTKLAICVDLSYPYDNIFTKNSYDSKTGCLLPNSSFNDSKMWLFNVIFIIVDYLKSTLQNPNLNYILYGIDSSGKFCLHFSYFYPLIDNPNKQFPSRIIIGTSSYYFFPFSKPRMRLDYIKNINSGANAIEQYPELIDYGQVDKRNIIQMNQMIQNMNNDNYLDIYYQYINNFLNYYKDPINTNIKNLQNQNVYNLNDDIPTLSFPLGTNNLPLTENQKKNLANLSASRDIVYVFYSMDTNIYGGVTPEGKNIPPIESPCQSNQTGDFRLFRGLNSFFSTKIDSPSEFNWSYVVIPKCGHNSLFANNTLLLANAINPQFWENKLLAPELYYFINSSLFKF